jgi:hypothetical protein
LLSSLNFSDGLRGQRLAPAKKGQGESRQFFQGDLSPRQRILIALYAQTDGQFADVRRGLGIPEAGGSAVVYWDGRHEVVFDAKSSGKSQFAGVIVWRDEVVSQTRQLIASYFVPCNFRIMAYSCK